MESYSIGIDVGGTFTDCAVVQRGRVVTTSKSPTASKAIDQGVLASIALAAEQLGLTTSGLLARTDRVIHGSTVATNAIVERRGAITGLLTTAGHEDAILIGKAIQKAAGLSERELTHQAALTKPRPLVPRSLIRGVVERIDRDGDVIVPLDEAQALRAATELVEGGIESLAISFLWSFLNPLHERLVSALCRRKFPDVRVVSSHEVAPLIGEYERTSTTALHAYVAPAVTEYLERLESRLQADGYPARLWVAHCAGGVTTVNDLAQRPLLMLDSGPASGVVGAQHFGGLGGESNLICTDMGGTTFDVSSIYESDYALEDEPIIAQYHYLLPKIAISSIGSGGGSIVWSEGDGSVKVGPRSAGADPGPACYGQGGQDATITDVDLALGFLNPSSFLGGRKRLNKELALQSIERVAAAAGRAALEVAIDAYTVVNSQMADLISRATIERGHDPRDFSLFAYGGAAACHIAYLARELGITRTYISPHASVFSALGMLCGQTVRTTERAISIKFPLNDDHSAHLAKVTAELSSELISGFAHDKVALDGLALSPVLHMKYAMQPKTLAVGLGEWSVDEDPEGRGLIVAFEQAYARLYGQDTGYPGAGFEASKCSVSAAALDTERLVSPLATDKAVGPPPAVDVRPVVFPGFDVVAECSVIDGRSLTTGNTLVGPCIVERMGDTVVIPPFASGEVDQAGNLVLQVEVP